MYSQRITILLIFLLSLNLKLYAGVVFIDRNVTKNSRDATLSSKITKLGYFKYYERLPKEINLPIVANHDMTPLKNKKYLFIGYGVDPLMDVNVTGCKIMTIDGNKTRVCFPWWRIDRVYECNATLTDVNSMPFLQDIASKTHPPKIVHICNKYTGDVNRTGGLVTCTAYYDKQKNAQCEKNPESALCLVNNCPDYVRKHCNFKEYYVGGGTSGNMSYPATSPVAKTLSKSDYADVNISDASLQDRYIQVGTLMYECPSYTDTSQRECVDEKTLFINPRMCRPDSNPADTVYDSIWKYCDENNYSVDAVTGAYTFYGICDANETNDSTPRVIECTADICTDEMRCEEPVYQTITKSNTVVCDKLERMHKPCSDVIDLFSPDVNNSLYMPTYINGQPVVEYNGRCYISVLTGYKNDNPFEKDPDCIRVSIPADEVSAKAQIKVEAAGKLDDDIFVILHREGGGFKKVYCNQQHNESGSSLKWSINFSGYSMIGEKRITAKTYDISGSLVKTYSINIYPKENPAVIKTSINIASDDKAELKTNTNLTIYLETTKSITRVEINPDANGAGIDIKATKTQTTSNKSAPKINYNGTILTCIDNDGSYSFVDTFDIYPDEILSVQRATENMEEGCTPFNCGRTHGCAVSVIMAGYEVSPSFARLNNDYDYYQYHGKCHGLGGAFRVWENTLYSLSLLFPYAGKYTLDFYSTEGDRLASVTLDESDFAKINESPNGRMQLRLGATVIHPDSFGYYNTRLFDTENFGFDPNAPDFNRTAFENDESIIAACLDDMAEVGCGVLGGHALRQIDTNLTITDRYNNSTTSDVIDVLTPRDIYVKNTHNHINKIVVTNYANASVTEIPLVYPIAYMNQIYISKLRLFEKLQYECYKDEYETCPVN